MAAGASGVAGRVKEGSSKAFASAMVNINHHHPALGGGDDPVAGGEATAEAEASPLEVGMAGCTGDYAEEEEEEAAAAAAVAPAAAVHGGRAAAAAGAAAGINNSQEEEDVPAALLLTHEYEPNQQVVDAEEPMEPAARPEDWLWCWKHNWYGL
jgi:hypothetical protein